MTRSREGVAALYVVIMLIVPLVGFPFVQPAAMVASAETIEGGNAPSADMFESALNAPSSAVIEYNTASDLTLSYDLTGVSASTYTITLFDSDQNQIDSASSGSDADTLTLTIAANEVTSSQTLDAELTADGMQYGGDSIDVTAVDLSGSPAVDVTSETVTAAGDTPLTVGYDAEGAIGGGDTLRMELWDPNSNTKLDTVTGLESDLRGAANPLWPAGDYDGGGQVEVRLIKNAGNQLASDTAQISEGAFITSSSVEHHTGSQPTMNQVAINEQSINMGNQGSLIFFYLHTAGNTQQRDIGTVGADESTQLWVNFTVENYNPEIMMGAADVAEWQTSPSQTTTGTNLSILLNTTSVQRHYDWQNPVPFDPSQWPDRAEMATHGVDAGAELMVGDMPDSGPAADLHGARLNTDAQAYTVPTVNNESLEFNVAAPHCTVDASGGGCDDEPANVNDDGFYEAVVPSSFVQNAWGEVSASDLTGTYTSGGTTETLSLTVSEQPDGDLFIRAENIHYSDGTIALEPSSEDSSGGGGSGGSSTTATPTPTPTATPTPTPEPTVTPEPTETPEPTATPVPTETVATATDTPAPDPTTTEGTGPGFGAVGALTAIVLGIALLARRP